MNFGQSFKRVQTEKTKFNANNIKLTKSLRKKVQYTIPLFFIVTIICWGLFYNYSAQNMQKNSERLTEQVLNSVVQTLESIFLNLEHTAMALSQVKAVDNMLSEKDPVQFHAQSSRVVQELNSVYQPDGLVDDILIFDSDYNFARLRGEIGNTVAARVAYLLSENENARHISFSAEGDTYIAYITSVTQNGQKMGSIVFLLQSTQLVSLFEQYNTNNSLIICLLASQNVFVSNRQEFVNLHIDDIALNSSSFTERNIGLTPFSIFVADDGTNLQNTVQYFAIATISTFIIMLLMQLVLYGFLSKNLFKPMFSIMNSANNVGKNNELLTLTGNDDFDILVDSINLMIIRLEENTHDLFEMQYKIKGGEIEKQNALILSLKKQINAHFMVNTINNVKRLNELGKTEQAGEICDGLSDLLRYAHNADEYISGFDEMYIMRKYVSIMQIRYPGSFTVQYDIDDVLDEYYLPRMLIQPILENAITHGVQGVENGHVKLSAKISKDKLIIKVIDNGKGISNEALQKLNEKLNNIEDHQITEGLSGIALLNIQKRIRLAFGSEYGIKVAHFGNQGTQVFVLLPIINVDDF